MALVAAVLALLAALSIAFLDLRLARAIAALPEGVHAFFQTGTEWLDVATGKKIGDSFPGLALLVLGLAAWIRPAARAAARVLVLVALSNLCSGFLAGLFKPVFGRLRPFQIAETDWVDRFFAGGHSFPSGHTAFYFGLCLPLAWALPRWRVPLLLPALFIALARPLVNDHFAGDVLGSMAITTGISAGWIAVLQRYAKLERFGPSSARPEPGLSPGSRA